MSLKKEILLDMYKKLVMIRRFEEKVAKLYAEGEIPGFVHLYVGEEAVAVGACANLRKDDYITSTHRGHGHLIAKGGDVKYMMAELFGKKTGYCKGRGGSMHIAEQMLGILGANGIVGAGIPIAAGAALSAKLRKTDQVTVCFFGDGAANTTRFHEGINLASIWNLPVIYVCENNQYGIAISQTYSMKIKDISIRAKAYDIPGVVVDGQDVLAVYETVHEAIERAKKGKGPTLIECKTYRFRGHWEGDPEIYRPKGEVERIQKYCPIEKFKTKLSEMKILTEKKADEIEKEVTASIDDAVEFARESPYPEPDEALEDLFV